MMKKSLLAALIAPFVLLSPSARAENGITKDEIKVGMSGGITGPISAYMASYIPAMNVVFDKVNAAGGINGRKIKHIALDDGYDPQKAAENATKLLEQEKVFALVGGSGTATTKAALGVARAQNSPLFFPYTGGVVDPLIFSVRVGYPEEAEALVNFAVKTLKAKKVAVYYQDDAFGTAGKNAVAKTLSQHGMQISSEGKYDKNTNDPTAAIATFMKDKPDVIYFQTLTPPAIRFVKDAAAKGYKPTILSSSITTVESFVGELGKDATNIYVSEVLPPPTDSTFAISKQFQDDMKAAGKSANINSHGMEGYMAGRVFVEAMKKAGAEPTRKSLIAAMESIKDLDVGGLKLSFSATKHSGMSQNFIFKVVDGKGTMVH